MARLARSAPEKPGVARGDRREVDGRRERQVLRVDPEDGLATDPIREADRHLAVEAARPQEGRIEDVGAVRGGEHDDVRRLVEAVHLDEQLVERLLALVVAAAEPGAPLPADGVDLVDEHDRRRGRLGLREQVADAARPDADEQLDELGRGDAEERDLASPATARARSVLPVPGGPISRTPRGSLRPEAPVLVGLS